MSRALKRASRSFIPALRFHALTGAFDSFMRAIGLGPAFREAIVEALAARPGERVLDIGAGTGTLDVLLAQRVPGIRLVGIDADPNALDLARAKVQASGAAVELKEGRAERLPEADASFDKVVACLVVHHLPSAIKRAALREALRVLRPGGTLLLVDFGPLRGPLRALNPLLSRNLLEETGDHFAGRIPAILAEAGFADVHLLRAYGRVIDFYQATHPLGAASGKQS